MNNHHWGEKSRARMIGVSPALVICATGVLKQCRFDLTIPHMGGIRTVADQQELWKKGRTAPGKIVTHVDGRKKKSKHQSGLALDIVPWINGRPRWDLSHGAYEHIAELMIREGEMMGITITWGGHWKKFTDLPHYEISHWYEG